MYDGNLEQDSKRLYWTETNKITFNRLDVDLHF